MVLVTDGQQVHYVVLYIIQSTPSLVPACGTSKMYLLCVSPDMLCLYAGRVHVCFCLVDCW